MAWFLAVDTAAAERQQVLATGFRKAIAGSDAGTEGTKNIVFGIKLSRTFGCGKERDGMAPEEVPTFCIAVYTLVKLVHTHVRPV